MVVVKQVQPLPKVLTRSLGKCKYTFEFKLNNSYWIVTKSGLKIADQ